MTDVRTKPPNELRRRMVIIALVILIGGSALAYRHFTDPERIRVIVEAQLQRYAPGLVSVGSAEFSLFQGTVIHDVVVRASEGADFPPVLECPRIEVMHGPFGALVGRPKASAEEVEALAGPFGNSTQQEQLSSLAQTTRPERSEDLLP